MLLIVTKSLVDCIFPKMDALHCMYLIPYAPLITWLTFPILRGRNYILSTEPGWAQDCPYQRLLRLSGKEIVSPGFSLSGHSPLELGHDATNKTKLVDEERLHGGAHVERNCGPKWHLVATASWVHEPSDDSSSQLHIFWCPWPCGAGRAIPAVSCPNALPIEFESIISYPTIMSVSFH